MLSRNARCVRTRDDGVVPVPVPIDPVVDQTDIWPPPLPQLQPLSFRLRADSCNHLRMWTTSGCFVNGCGSGDSDCCYYCWTGYWGHPRPMNCGRSGQVIYWPALASVFVADGTCNRDVPSCAMLWFYWRESEKEFVSQEMMRKNSME